MSVISHESDRQMPDCAEIYKFSRLDSARHYTSYHRAVVYDGNTYAPAVIKRGAFSRKLASTPATMNITAPISSVFDMYRMGTPVYPVTVEVRRVLLDTPDEGAHMIFRGYVMSASLKGQLCGAKCQSIGAELERKIPTVTYQPSCNNDLFDTRCGLRRADFKMQLRVHQWLDDTHRGFFITSAGADSFGNTMWDKSAGYWSGGFCVYGNAKRFFTRSDSGFFGMRYVVMHYSIDDLEEGDTIDAYPGCSKSPQTCLNDFNNLENYVGFPYIPTLSPMKWGAQIVEREE